MVRGRIRVSVVQWPLAPTHSLSQLATLFFAWEAESSTSWRVVVFKFLLTYHYGKLARPFPYYSAGLIDHNDREFRILNSLDNSWCHQFSRTSKGVLQRHCSDAINRHRVAMSSILLSYVLSTLPTQNLIALCTARTSFTHVGNAKHFHHCAVLIAPIFLNAI